MLDKTQRNTYLSGRKVSKPHPTPYISAHQVKIDIQLTYAAISSEWVLSNSLTTLL